MPENIVINLEADTTALQKTIDLLEKLGQVDKQTAAEFRKATDEYKRGVDGAKKATDELASSTEKIGKKTKQSVNEAKGSINDLKGSLMEIGKVVGVAFSVQQVIQFGKEAFKAFAEAELNARKLKLAVGINGGVGSDFKMLIEQSEKLQKITIFSDDTIQNVQTAALQFGLTSKQVEKLIPLITDFASATGQDMSTAMDAVLRGLEGAGRGLQLYGIQVDSTKTKGENLAAIIDQLNEKFKGQAEIIANTASGKLEVTRNRWADFMEEVGESMTKLGEWSLAVMNPFLAKSLKDQEKFLNDRIERDEKRVEKYKELFAKSNVAALQIMHDDVIEKQKTATKEQSKEYGFQLVAIRALLKEKNLLEMQNTKEEEATVKTTVALKKLNEERRKQYDEIQKLQTIDVNNIPITPGAQEQGGEVIVRRGAPLGPENIDWEKLEKDTEEHLKIMESFYKDFAINVSFIISDGVSDFFQSSIENQITEIERLRDATDKSIEDQLNLNADRRQKDIISEREYRDTEKKLLDQKTKNEEAAQKKINEQKRKADLAERAQKLFNIGISTAQNAVQQPGPLGAFIPFWLALGGLQAGIVLAQPLPKYAKGTLSLERGRNRPGVDTIPILANEGEAITPTDIAKDYRPALAAMHKRAIPARVMNYLATNYTNNKSNLSSSFSLDYDKLGESLAYYMRDSNNVRIKNVREFADVLRGENHNVFRH